VHSRGRRRSLRLYLERLDRDAPVGLFTAVGHVTFTETGTFSGAQTTSIAGNLVEETVQGTYAVNPDCTGSATVMSTTARRWHASATSI
jgi:hypothetical protein